MSSRLVAADGGFGLIEVMVSMVLLSALAMSTFAVIDQSTKNSAQGRSRSVAADLAHDDLNRMRQMQFDTVANFEQQTDPAPIDGVSFHVTSTATWTTDSGADVSCTTPTSAGEPGAAYLHLNSSVTWPAMGTAKPVTADSIMVPRVKELDKTAGSLIFSIQDRSGNPVSGVAVVAGSQTKLTDNDGCAFFPQISAGSYNATFTKSGYIDKNNHAPGVAPVSIVAGELSSVSVDFDRAVTFNPIKFTGEDITSGVHTTGMTWPRASVVTQDNPTVVYDTTNSTWFATGQLYPAASGYAFYAGSCAGNNPATYVSNPQVMANQSIIPTPGQLITTAVAYMRPVTLTVTGAVSNDQLTWTAKPYTAYTSMAGCADPPVSGTFPTRVTGNPLKATATFYLPYGVYSICVKNSASTGSSSYRIGHYIGTNAPTAAYTSMPSLSSVALKSSAPGADSATASVAVSRTGTCS